MEDCTWDTFDFLIFFSGDSSYRNRNGSSSSSISHTSPKACGRIFYKILMVSIWHTTFSHLQLLLEANCLFQIPQGPAFWVWLEFWWSDKWNFFPFLTLDIGLGGGSISDVRRLPAPLTKQKDSTVHCMKLEIQKHSLVSWIYEWLDSEAVGDI